MSSRLLPSSSATPLASSQQQPPAKDTAPTPWFAYLAALLLAVAAGLLALSIKAAVIALVAIAALWFGRQILAKPLFGITIVFILYALMPTMRAAYNAYGLPVFTSGVRLFPEAIQMVILTHLLIRGARDPNKRLRLTWDDFPALLYVLAGVYGFTVGMAGAHPLAPINGWFVSITPAVFYLLIRWYRPTDPECDRLRRNYLLVFAALAFISVIDYTIRPELTINLYQAERGFWVPAGMTPSQFWHIYPRMQSLLYDENVFGSLCCLVSLLSLAHLMTPKARRGWWALLSLSCACLVLSLSRGALIAFAIGGGVLLLVRGAHRPRMIGAIVVILVLAGGLFYRFQENAYVKDVTKRLGTVNVESVENQEVVSDRTHQWERGWDIFVRNPSGTGLGTTGYAAHLSKVAEHQVADSIYFRILSEQGVPGAVCFLVTLTGIGWVLIRWLPVTHGETRALGVGLLAFHTGFCVHSAVANTYDYWFTASVYWILLAVFVSKAHHQGAALKASAREANQIEATA